MGLLLGLHRLGRAVLLRGASACTCAMYIYIYIYTYTYTYIGIHIYSYALYVCIYTFCFVLPHAVSASATAVHRGSLRGPTSTREVIRGGVGSYAGACRKFRH